jgi:hypothetical protein
MTPLEVARDPSFVPPPEIRRLRDLLRYRVNLLEQHNQTHNKIRDRRDLAGQAELESKRQTTQ